MFDYNFSINGGDGVVKIVIVICYDDDYYYTKSDSNSCGINRLKNYSNKISITNV